MKKDLFFIMNYFLTFGRAVMLRLWSVVFSITSTVLMGIFMVVVLVLGFDSLRNTTMDVILAVVAGLVVSIPLSWFFTKKLYAAGKNEDAPRIDEGSHGQFTKG